MTRGAPSGCFEFFRASRPWLTWAVALAWVAWSIGSVTMAQEPKELSSVQPSEIDDLLAQAWEAEGVKPSPIAPDSEFVRRAYLDFLGRIPSIDETREFLLSKEKTKREKLIETLLEDPDYAANFATVWRVALIGRSMMDNQEVDPAALETWLRRQFAANRPWNEIVTELIAGEGSNKEHGAVNFVLAHRGDGAVNLTSYTTRLFLGQQIQCTQCHDHPSNDWKQKDFWGINAYFKAVTAERVMVENNLGLQVLDHVEVADREILDDLDRYAAYDRRDGLTMSVGPTYLDGRKTDPTVDTGRRKELAALITARDNLQFARAFVNRMWAHFMGRGFVHPVDDFGDHNVPSIPELLDLLAEDFRDHDFDIKHLIRLITRSKAYHLTSRTIPENELDELLFSHMNLKPMTPEQLYSSLLVATNADKVDAADAAAARARFARQFARAFANDEGAESVEFQGTIPQALMMMNGELIAKATTGKAGSQIRKLFDEAKLQPKNPDVYLITQLYLAALSRPPSARELAVARRLIASDRYPDQVAEDLFWALLNSNEFILNH